MDYFDVVDRVGGRFVDFTGVCSVNAGHIKLYPDGVELPHAVACSDREACEAMELVGKALFCADRVRYLVSCIAVASGQPGYYTSSVHYGMPVTRGCVLYFHDAMLRVSLYCEETDSYDVLSYVSDNVVMFSSLEAIDCMVYLLAKILLR